MDELNYTSGTKVADAIYGAIMDVANNAYKNIPSDKTLYGTISGKKVFPVSSSTSAKYVSYSVRIQNQEYTNVGSFRSIGELNVGDRVICLVPNGNMSDLIIRDVANGITQSTGEQGPRGETGPEGPQGEQGYSFIQLQTTPRNFTTAQWNQYGAYGHSESWVNVTNTASIRVGDLGVLYGTNTDTSSDVLLVGEITAVATTQVTMTTINCVQSLKGADGTNGTNGTDGATFIPSVSSEGVISWTNNMGLDNPTSVNIKGPQGNDGANGADGVNATITAASATIGTSAGTPTVSVSLGGTESARTFSFSFDGLKGETGERGPEGPEGPAGGVNSVNGQTGDVVIDVADSGALTYYKQTLLQPKTGNLDAITWVGKTWIGLTDFNGSFVWTDGENIYYSNGSSHYVLNKATSTWTVKTWNYASPVTFSGQNIWTDGNNIYLSSGTDQFVLDKSTSTWNTKTWSGLTSFNGNGVWTDGNNIYYSAGSVQRVLNIETSTWTTQTWTGLTAFNAASIWTDGEKIICETNYVLDKSTSTWTSIDLWDGDSFEFYSGTDFWTDGESVYQSGDNGTYRLNKSTRTWTNITWVGLSSTADSNIRGLYVWTDGDEIYYSYGTNQYVLSKSNKYSNNYARIVNLPDMFLYDKMVNQVTNANDGYIKYESGRLVCWGRARNPNGQYAYDWQTSVAFPIPFTSIPNVYCTPDQYSGSGCMAVPSGTSTSNFTACQYSKYGGGGTSMYVNWYAIGKWK